MFKSLKNPEKLTDALKTIRHALASPDETGKLKDAVTALTYFAKCYKGFLKELACFKPQRITEPDLVMYERSITAVQNWLEINALALPPQIIRLHFLYLETGPRTFQKIASQVKAEIKDNCQNEGFADD